jgi:IS605 OrfB family transposase
VRFSYRGDEVAAQAATGAIRYDISVDPATGRWYTDASWRAPSRPVPALEELRQSPVLAVDLNHGHLAAWVVTPDGNPAGPPVTAPLVLAGLPAAQRDGRVRAAITALITLARQHGCAAIAIEDLDFAQAREQGREKTGGRPSRGRRGRGFRRILAGLPTARFRDRLVQMTANAGLHVIVVDPAYTSRWAGQWLAPLREQHAVTSGHHAAAVVIGRRAHGHRARRRAGVTRPGPADPGVRAAPRAPQARAADRNGGSRQATRQPPPRRRKTGPAQPEHPPDQAAHDRSGPPDSQDHLPLSQ